MYSSIVFALQTWDLGPIFNLEKIMLLFIFWMCIRSLLLPCRSWEWNQVVRHSSRGFYWMSHPVHPQRQCDFSFCSEIRANVAWVALSWWSEGWAWSSSPHLLTLDCLGSQTYLPLFPHFKQCWGSNLRAAMLGWPLLIGLHPQPSILYFETGPHYVALAGLELPMWPRQSLNFVSASGVHRLQILAEQAWWTLHFILFHGYFSLYQFYRFSVFIFFFTFYWFFVDFI